MDLIGPPPGNNWVAATSVVARLFSSEECKRILELGEKLPLEPGRMVRPGLATRRCQCAWMDHESDSAWVYERIVQMVQAANQNYRFDLLGMMDPLQFTRYDAATADELSWHLDCGEGPNTTRKLSVSVQLSDPDEYDGGDLEFTASPPLPFAKLQGAAILFPSMLAHRVMPITRGSRFSLVAFINGPPFR
jgi:PKHD-type hydroxylase